MLVGFIETWSILMSDQARGLSLARVLTKEEDCFKEGARDA
jgi:hypothetical protein